MLVAFYDRVSTEYDSQATSVENQISLFKSRLNAENWNLYKIYFDKKTAKNTDRFGLKQMLSDAEKKRFDCIVVKNVSRLARNSVDGLVMDRKLRSLDIRWLTLDGIYDTQRNDEFYLNILFGFAQKEGEEQSRRIKGGRRGKALRGEFIGSISPYGYKKVDERHIEPAEDESTQTVRFIFDEYLKRKSTGAIAKELNEKGIKTPFQYQQKLNAGSEWRDTTVIYILKNRVYIGEMVQCRVETKGYIIPGRKKIDSSNHIVIENACKSIIDNDDFYRVEEILNERSKKINHHTTKHLFAGVAKCHDCKSGMHFKKDRGYYVCGKYQKKGKGHCSNHKIMEDKIIELVTEDIRKLAANIQNDEIINEIKNKIKDNSPMLDKKLKSIICEISKLKQREKILLNKYLDKILSDEEFARYRISISDELKEKEKIKLDIQKQINGKEDIKQKYEKLEVRVKNFMESDILTPSMLYSIIDSIEVIDSENIIINYKFLNIQ